MDDLIYIFKKVWYREQPQYVTASESAVGSLEERIKLEEFSDGLVHVVAGVGNPERFFEQMRNKGINVVEHAFTDHYPFAVSDLEFGDSFPILMTEKDAVKCYRFATENMWYLPIDVYMDNDFEMQLLNLLEKKQDG